MAIETAMANNTNGHKGGHNSDHNNDQHKVALHLCCFLFSNLYVHYFFGTNGYKYSASQAAASQPPNSKGLAMRAYIIQFLFHIFFIQCLFNSYFFGQIQPRQVNQILQDYLVFSLYLFSNPYYPIIKYIWITQGSEEWPWQMANKRP